MVGISDTGLATYYVKDNIVISFHLYLINDVGYKGNSLFVG